MEPVRFLERLIPRLHRRKNYVVGASTQRRGGISAKDLWKNDRAHACLHRRGSRDHGGFNVLLSGGFRAA